MLTHRTAAARTAPRHAPRHAMGVLPRLLQFLAISRSRQALAHLDAHILRDIGLTRDQALAEADRAAWDVAPGWRR